MDRGSSGVIRSPELPGVSRPPLGRGGDAAGLRLVLLVVGTVRENGKGDIYGVVKRKAPLQGGGEGLCGGS
jgi:hypothetical protein